MAANGILLLSAEDTKEVLHFILCSTSFVSQTIKLYVFFSILALSGRFASSSPKVGAFGSSRTLHLYAKGSPFGRAGTAGD